MPVDKLPAAIRLFLLICLGGCASTATGIVEKLDWATGVTVTYVDTPLVLYRETPARGAYARDYAQIGPVAVNRSGVYKYYLWVGAWATMQSSDVTRHRDGFETVVIFADGEPLILELGGSTPDAIGVSEPTYLNPVASSTDAYYPVTVDQIRLIAQARQIRLRTTGSSPREFEMWDYQIPARSCLAEFLRNAQM